MCSVNKIIFCDNFDKAVGFFLVGAALAEACAIYALVIAMKLSGMMG